MKVKCLTSDVFWFEPNEIYKAEIISHNKIIVYDGMEDLEDDWGATQVAGTRRYVSVVCGSEFEEVAE